MRFLGALCLGLSCGQPTLLCSDLVVMVRAQALEVLVGVVIGIVDVVHVRCLLGTPLARILTNAFTSVPISLEYMGTGESPVTRQWT